jgi:hypothetical protein
MGRYPLARSVFAAALAGSRLGSGQRGCACAHRAHSPAQQLSVASQTAQRRVHRRTGARGISFSTSLGDVTSVESSPGCFRALGARFCTRVVLMAQASVAGEPLSLRPSATRSARQRDTSQLTPSALPLLRFARGHFELLF